jgi:translation initiation factor 2 alpha subunit (eIF-2alpha)
MVRKLDAYLKKVGAWTMEEVYATRIEELEKWIAKHHEDIAEFNRKLEDDPKNQEIQASLRKVQDDLVRHQRTFGQVTENKTSDRWF